MAWYGQDSYGDRWLSRQVCVNIVWREGYGLVWQTKIGHATSKSTLCSLTLGFICLGICRKLNWANEYVMGLTAQSVILDFRDITYSR